MSYKLSSPADTDSLVDCHQVQTLYEEQEGLLNSHMNAIQVSFQFEVCCFTPRCEKS